MSVLRPTIFGRHCLLERISIGGMAEVFRARPLDAPDVSQHLAFKRILPHLAEDDEFIRMFVDEAKIAVQLHHRNICEIYELGRLDSSYFIVMEYIAGKDLLALQNWLRKRRKIMSVTQACYLVAQACKGLDYAHHKLDENGEPLRIIHRDISPQNVLVSYDGAVKVIDFGIARAATSNEKTQVGVLKGKFGYMSPEQVAGASLDHRSDIFAAGTLLWELLTARRLFHGETDFATLEKVRQADVQPPSERNKRIPAALDAIVLKALAKDRDERYQTAGEMAKALGAFLDTVQPRYDRTRLADWMRKNFDDEIANEAVKRQEFEQFVSAEDIEEYRRIHALDLAVEDDDAEDEDATRVWLADGEQGDDDGVHVVVDTVDDPLGLHASDDALASVILSDDVVDMPVQRMDSASLVSNDLGNLGHSVRRRRQIWTFTVVALLIALVLAAALLLQGEDSAGPLVVSAEPATATLHLDGVRIEGEPPWALQNVSAGDHVLEVRAEGYVAWMETIEVSADTPPLQVELEPVALDEAIVSLSALPSGAQVYLNGQLVGGMGADRRIALPSGEASVIEVRADGHFVEVIERTLPAGVREDIILTPRPIEGVVLLSSDPPGEAFLDGEPVGRTDPPLRLSGLNIFNTYALEIRPDSPSFRSYESELVFDTFFDMRLQPRLPRRGVAAGDETVEVGTLSLEQPPSGWYRVEIDGQETGLSTPLTGDQALVLRTGARSVRLVRPHAFIELPVTIDEGRPVVLTSADYAQPTLTP